MSYKQLNIWRLARELSVDIHKLSLSLPKYEQYEVGSQIRRSSKSTRANIVEGYGRRTYKNEFIKFIIYALSSNDETIDHLETLFETGSIKDEEKYNEIHGKLIDLGKQLNSFLTALNRQHNRLRGSC
jgi:four helix bundle protein